MTFSNNVSYMVKILTFYIIMTRFFTMSSKGLLTLVLKLQDLFWIQYDTYEGWKSKNNYNTVGTIEQICVLDPVKENIYDILYEFLLNIRMISTKLISLYKPHSVCGKNVPLIANRDVYGLWHVICFNLLTITSIHSIRKRTKKTARKPNIFTVIISHLSQLDTKSIYNTRYAVKSQSSVLNIP